MTEPTTIDATSTARLEDALDHTTVDALARSGVVHFRGFDIDHAAFSEAAKCLGARTTCDPAKAASTGLSGRQDRIGRALRGARRLSERLPLGIKRPAGAPRLAPWGGSGINPHTENAFLPLASPDLVWFYCERPAEDGGASIVSDGTEIAAALHEDTLDRLRAASLRYRTPLLRAQWEAVYDTDDSDELRRRLEPVADLDFEFRSDGSLHLDYRSPQVRPTMLNEAEAVSTNLLSRRPYRAVGNREHDVTADDQPVDAALVQAVLDATLSCSHEIDLEAGDVLLIDNSRVMHGRTPFTDPRRRVLTMCTFLDPQPSAN